MARQRTRFESRMTQATLAMALGGLPLALSSAAQPADPGGGAVAAQPAEPTRASVLDEAREQALQIVLDASRSEDPRERAAAIEAILPVPDRAQTMALLALEDENPGVRFAALVTIGQLELEGLGPAALELANDDNLSVCGAAVFAAQRCGQDVGQQLSILPRMLASQRPGVRGNAAMLLGLLGDESAVPMLQEMAALPMPRVDPSERVWLQLQFAEAMLRLDPDNEAMLGVLRSSVFSPIDDVRILALHVVGEVGDQSMLGALESLVGDASDPIQIRIAGGRALATMGNANGRPILMAGASYNASHVVEDAEAFLRSRRNDNGREAALMRQLIEDAALQADIAADVRAQSAFGLADLDDLGSARKLAAMLNDPHPIVRLAAAAAVLEAQARR
ncbi:MAG: hypothetical protein ACIAXF_15750 [Phycisphaerales bacterium JB063]